MPIRTPPVAVCWVSALTALASPKSATLTRPPWASSAISTFSGLTSRWMSPARWAAARAETTGSSSESARIGRHRRLLADHVAQRVSGDVLHREEDRAVVVALVVDAHHVGVVEPGGRAGLADEPLGEVVVVTEAGVHHLDGDGAVEADVGGLVDTRHAAAGDATADAIAAVEESTDERVGAPRRASAPRAGPRACPVGSSRGSTARPPSPDGEGSGGPIVRISAATGRPAPGPGVAQACSGTPLRPAGGPPRGAC